MTAILGSIFIDELNSDFERRTLKEQSQKAHSKLNTNVARNEARGYEELTNSCPNEAVAPRDLSKAPMKPSLIVMFLASAGSGNKMDSKECLALKKCSRS